MSLNITPSSKNKSQIFSPIIFVITFFVFAILTALQNLLLGLYINFSEIPHQYGILVMLYWILVSAIFTLITQHQIRKKFENPIQRMAEATSKVARGDFSIYLKPMHTLKRADYLDSIFLDFNKMVEELGSMETMKTDFFANVSHEIKTPLSVIHNYSQMLNQETLSVEQRKDYTDTIIAASSRLSELITNILKLTKLENQSIKPIAESYDLCRQLCDCAISFENLWDEKNIIFEMDMEDCATIEADKQLMELVWNNLLSNAIKFTQPGESVTIKQTSTESELIVSISDTGCGMNEETIKHIFEKFYQGDTSHATQGNGLGLALTLRILQLLDYSITVESHPGKGTTFMIRIPTNLDRKDHGHE